AIRDLENKKRELVLRLAMTPKTNVIVKDRTHTANGVHESVHVEEDARSKSVRDDIESDMQQVDYQIAQKRREQEAIRTEIRTLQTEMATL
ncbi:MAG: hypothetical protein KDD38_08700, partial [Bdellovibrionales bacterium]|nr:hypothetical protein [Bdellovibrionales bacterium]